MTTVADIAEVLGGERTFARPIDSAQELRERVREGLPYAALEAVVNQFGIPMELMARLLDIPATGHSLGRDSSDRLARFARILSEAGDALGGTGEAAHWLLQPNRALGGRIPAHLLDTDVGAEEVEHLLGRIEQGVFS